VNVTVIETVRGSDGKRYLPRQLAPAELRRVRILAHALICRDGLSYRQAQQAMLSGYAVRRSLGQLHKDLHRFACGLPQCLCVPIEPPGPPPAAQPAASVHQTGVGLAATLSGRG
jgi:hypothetical protein